MKAGAHERERKRRAEILSLWQQRAIGQRTENDVATFYGELERAFPDLLDRRGGDPYRSLMRDLQGYIEDAERKKRKKL